MSEWWDRVALGNCGRCGKPNDRKGVINICSECGRKEFERFRITLGNDVVALVILVAFVVGLLLAMVIF